MAILKSLPPDNQTVRGAEKCKQSWTLVTPSLARPSSLVVWAIDTPTNLASVTSFETSTGTGTPIDYHGPARGEFHQAVH